MGVPGNANALLLRSAAAAGGYQVERSVRLNSADSAYFSRTPASSGNRKTWTFSCWVKKQVSAYQQIFTVQGTTVTNFFQFAIENNNQIAVRGASNTTYLQTTQVLRDPSAWYHLVLSVDTTQSTASNTIKLYLNGMQITTFDTASYPAQNTDLNVSTTNAHWIGRAQYSGFGAVHSDCYLANVEFVDELQLTPSSFAETDATTGQWVPKAYTGSYGTNGFHLDFADNSNNTATTLGKDTSGNGNNWTPNNLSVTAGAGNDSLVDTPTSFGTDTGVGNEVRGNYCTWNPLINGDTAANGNLDVTNDTARGTQKLLEYNAYWEITSTGGTTTAGVVSDGGTTNTTTVANGKTYGFKLSAAGALEYINITDGGSFTSIITGLTGIQFPYASAASSTTGSLNAGQRPFAANAPSGFKALCDTNLPSTTITTSGSYTGNGVADGPFVYLNGVPTAMTVDGNAVTFGTHADKLSNGFKIRTTSTTYNQNALTYNYSITSTGDPFKYARAQAN